MTHANRKRCFTKERNKATTTTTRVIINLRRSQYHITTTQSLAKFIMRNDFCLPFSHCHHILASGFFSLFLFEFLFVLFLSFLSTNKKPFLGLLHFWLRKKTANCIFRLFWCDRAFASRNTTVFVFISFKV